jgi:hypothetical protein
LGREYELEVSPETTLADQLSGTVAMHPVRKIVASRAAVRGVVASRLNDQSIATESLLELDFCTLLEFDFRVRRYGMQPFRIKWTDAEGKRRQYTPDVLVHYCPGRIQIPPTVFEIKHTDDLKANWDEYKPKFKAVIAALKPLGMRFRIATEKQIRTPRLTNARFLMSYVTARMLCCDEAEFEMQMHLRRSLYRVKTSSPRALLQSVSPSPTIQARYLPWLWYMVASEHIGCNLDEPLTMISPIWTYDDANSVKSSTTSIYAQPWPRLTKLDPAS